MRVNRDFPQAVSEKAPNLVVTYYEKNLQQASLEFEEEGMLDHTKLGKLILKTWLGFIAAKPNPIQLAAFLSNYQVSSLMGIPYLREVLKNLFLEYLGRETVDSEAKHTEILSFFLNRTK